MDWEIGSALNKSKDNSRCGVLGIILPDHPDYGKKRCNPNLLPPRLAANIEGDDPYVRLYDWPGDGSLSVIREWVHICVRAEGRAATRQLLEAVQDQQGRIHSAVRRKRDVSLS